MHLREYEHPVPRLLEHGQQLVQQDHLAAGLHQHSLAQGGEGLASLGLRKGAEGGGGGERGEGAA